MLKSPSYLRTSYNQGTSTGSGNAFTHLCSHQTLGMGFITNHIVFLKFHIFILSQWSLDLWKILKQTILKVKKKKCEQISSLFNEIINKAAFQSSPCFLSVLPGQAGKHMLFSFSGQSLVEV